MVDVVVGVRPWLSRGCNGGAMSSGDRLSSLRTMMGA